MLALPLLLAVLSSNARRPSATLLSCSVLPESGWTCPEKCFPHWPIFPVVDTVLRSPFCQPCQCLLQSHDSHQPILPQHWQVLCSGTISIPVCIARADNIFWSHVYVQNSAEVYWLSSTCTICPFHSPSLRYPIEKAIARTVLKLRPARALSCDAEQVWQTITLQIAR